MICTAISARTTDEAAHHVRKAVEQGTDLVELRLDLMPDADWKTLVRNKSCPVVVTVRSVAHGGRFSGDARSQAAILQQAADLGADYVDWEWTLPGSIDRKSSKLVVSLHTKDPVPEGLDSFLARARGIRADVVKAAATPQTSRDVLRLIERTSSWSGPRIVIPMGPWGEAVRVLYRRFGHAWTYAAIDRDHQTAPGQITLEELVSLFRVKNVTEATRAFAVLGNPVAHSRGPDIFNAAFRAMGLDAVYVRIPVDDSLSLREAVEFYRLSGASVTLPHKGSAIAACDDVDPSTRRVGACNTLIRREEKLHGANTDGPAVLEALQKKISLSGRNVLVLGAGGTARTIASVLTGAGAAVTVANRTPGRAERLAGEFRCETAPMTKVYGPAWDVVINATSAGMTPHEEASPVEARLFKKGMVVMDVVYTPPRTKFLKEAERAGAVTIGGREMFLLQAAMQFELFTGHGVTADIMQGWRTMLDLPR